MSFLFGFLMLLTAVFLILLVLIQRGRGGGLAGAFGGMGGQSAFGTKAGDLFTRITIGVAAFWIVLCVGAIKVLGHKADLFGPDNKTAVDGKDPGMGTGTTGTGRTGTGTTGTGTGTPKGDSDKPSGSDTKPTGGTETTPGGKNDTKPGSGKETPPTGGKDATPDNTVPPAGPPAKSDSSESPK